MSVTVRAKLPKGDTNGLAQWEQRLADNPDGIVPIVALVRPDTIERRPHDADNPQVVKCTLLHVEAVPDNAEGKAVDGILREIYEARTGKLVLPFEEDGE